MITLFVIWIALSCGMCALNDFRDSTAHIPPYNPSTWILYIGSCVFAFVVGGLFVPYTCFRVLTIDEITEEHDGNV